MSPYTKTNFFTPERRQLIQTFLSSLAPILVGLGITTEAEAEQWVILAGAGVQFVAGVINLINLRGWDLWTAIRGVIYTAATTVAPALTVLGYVDEAVAESALQYVSLGLTALSAGVAIFTSGKQQRTPKLKGTEAEG
jgi:hypothetical protein